MPRATTTCRNAACRSRYSSADTNQIQQLRLTGMGVANTAPVIGFGECHTISTSSDDPEGIRTSVCNTTRAASIFAESVDVGDRRISANLFNDNNATCCHVSISLDRISDFNSAMAARTTGSRSRRVSHLKLRPSLSAASCRVAAVKYVVAMSSGVHFGVGMVCGGMRWSLNHSAQPISPFPYTLSI
jgi:hypothetical protein